MMLQKPSSRISLPAMPAHPPRILQCRSTGDVSSPELFSLLYSIHGLYTPDISMHVPPVRNGRTENSRLTDLARDETMNEDGQEITDRLSFPAHGFLLMQSHFSTMSAVAMMLPLSRFKHEK